MLDESVEGSVARHPDDIRRRDDNSAQAAHGKKKKKKKRDTCVGVAMAAAPPKPPPPPPAAPQLPPGWEAHQDEGSGDFYYYNAVTGESTWERPGATRGTY